MKCVKVQSDCSVRHRGLVSEAPGRKNKKKSWKNCYEFKSKSIGKTQWKITESHRHGRWVLPIIWGRGKESRTSNSEQTSPGLAAQGVRVSPCAPKCYGFHPGQGMLWGAMDQRFSLTSMFLLLPPHPLSVSLPSSLSKINGNILRWGLKKWGRQTNHEIQVMERVLSDSD